MQNPEIKFDINYSKKNLMYYKLKDVSSLINKDDAITEISYKVDLSKKKFNVLMKISQKVHRLIGCRGVTRSDFKFYKNKFYLLEINTQPGMTKLSLVPEISAHKGINFINLIELILKDAETNK